MDNKVYYGEYSLKHWLDLIIKGNIKLPWYQRSFVWEKGQIENLIKTFDNNQFVPPIIIGAVKKNDEWENYILDGQQRLTSILFAKCNKYIDKKDFSSQRPNSQIVQLADDLLENEDDRIDEEIKMIQWNFNEIIRNKKIDLEELEIPFYKVLFVDEKDDQFFEDHFLGFAYIKPNTNIIEQEQSKFYSDIFRNINTGGKKLTRLETRRSLYFLKENLKDFFAPDFLTNIKVETSSKESGLMDSIKYLSILSQFKGNNSSLLRYGGRDWEKNEAYYKKYIMSVVDNNLTNELQFDVSYPTNVDFNERMENLKMSISNLDIPRTFNSIIDMDMYIFGLMNEVLYLNNQIDDAKKDNLKTELDLKIQELRETDNHKNNPNALKYLKTRITASIDIYSKYRKLPNE